MKGLIKLIIGLIVVYLVYRILAEYLRPVQVTLERPASPPPPPPLARSESRPERVNVNTADADALMTVPGIGPALAARIIARREEAGPFPDLDALTQVRGIGPALLARIRPLVTVN